MDRLVLIVVVFIACVGYAELAAPDEPANAHARDDIALLELVLDDLTKCDNSSIPLSLTRHVPRNIHFSRSPIRRRIQREIQSEKIEHAFIVCLPNELDPLKHADLWTTMTEVEQESIRHAIANIGERHAFDSFGHDFDPKNTAIHMIDAPNDIDIDGPKIPYGALFPVQASPPGYSGDRRYAVVHLYFPDFFHSSYATYVLVSEGEKWTIKYRGFITYT
jgi:hypothetical protein